MKLNNIAKILLAGAAMSALASCHNQEKVFPDYDGGVTAYFAYQYPVRTIVLGESETFDNSLDNQHKCIIYGTMGGAYKGKDIVLDIAVDNTLTDNLYFDADCEEPVKAMPAEYYTLSSDQLVYGGNHMGGVEVQLTDAFFADPDAIKNTYVIPVQMTNIVKGADQILAGTPAIEGEPALKTDPTQWAVAPKDFTLYAVKYVNPWDGSWLRRGVDTITEAGQTTTEVRHGQYVENDEVMYLTTESLNSVVFPMTTNVSVVVPPPTQYCLSMTNNVAGDAWGQQTVYNLSTPITSGSTYILSFVAKGTAEAEAPIFLADADGNQSYGYPSIPFTTEWTKVQLEILPSTESSTIMINTGACVGTFYLDDVSLVEKGKSEEYIADGDFPTAERPAGWNGWGGTTPAAVVPEGYTEEELLPTVQIVPMPSDLVLTFDESGNCTVSSKTEGVTATGTGKYVKDGEKKAWANKDRDAIYLDYQVDFGSKQYAIKDTLDALSRENTVEQFSPTLKK